MLSLKKFVCVSACHNSHDHSHASYFSSVFLSMHGGHRPCGAGAEFGRPAELWQGFVPHSQSSPSLYLGHASHHCLILFDLQFFGLTHPSGLHCCFPNKVWTRASVLGFVDSDCCWWPGLRHRKGKPGSVQWGTVAGRLPCSAELETFGKTDKTLDAAW